MTWMYKRSTGKLIYSTRRGHYGEIENSSAHQQLKGLGASLHGIFYIAEITRRRILNSNDTLLEVVR